MAKTEKRREHLREAGCILVFFLLSFLYVLPPAMRKDLILGDDTRYHLNRILEMTDHLRHGDFRPDTYTWSFGKISLPIGIFYPQFTLYPFALGTLITDNWVTGIYAGIAFYTFLTLLNTYLAVRRMDGSREQAFLTALLYAFCSYRFFDAFTRFALGEYLSMTFLPLVLYGFYAVFFGRKRDWWVLGLGMGLLLWSHVLSPFLTVLFLIPVGVVSLFFMKEKAARLVRLLPAAGLALLVGAVFWIPMAEQETAQTFEQPSPYELAQMALHPLQLLSSSFRNHFYDMDVNGNVYNIGIVLMATAIAGLFLWHFMSVRCRVTWLLGCAAVVLSTTVIPWRYLQNTPISLIQFPWRFLMLASLFLSCAAGEMVCTIPGRAVRRHVLSAALGAVVLVLYFGSVCGYLSVNGAIHTHLTAEDDICEEEASISEYLPVEAEGQVEDLKNHMAVLDGVRKSLSPETIQSGVNTQIYTDPDLVEADTAELPAAWYKNLHVYQKVGEDLVECLVRKSARGMVEADLYGDGVVYLVYEPSFADHLSAVLTLAGIVLTIVLAVQRLFQRSKPIKA